MGWGKLEQSVVGGTNVQICIIELQEYSRVRGADISESGVKRSQNHDSWFDLGFPSYPCSGAAPIPPSGRMNKIN